MVPGPEDSQVNIPNGTGGCDEGASTRSIWNLWITLHAFDSGYWKLIIAYKSGAIREIPVLSVEHGYLNDVISLKQGDALSVICGCKDSIYDIDKIAAISVCYIDDEVGQVLRSEELIIGPEN